MKKVIIGVLLVLLVGCAQLGLVTPQNTDQKIAYAYGSLTGVLNTIAAATTAGTLSSVNATKANTMVLNAKTILDGAKAEEGTQPTDALNDLNLVTQALTAVQTYLTANGVKK